MQLTTPMLNAAARKALDMGLLPRHGPVNELEAGWRGVKAVVEAALEVAGDAEEGSRDERTPAEMVPAGRA